MKRGFNKLLAGLVGTWLAGAVLLATAGLAPSTALAAARPAAAEAAAQAAEAVIPSFTWSKGVREEQPPYVDGVGIEAMSCATPTDCVALDQNDGVLTSSDPAGGPKAWHIRPDSFPVTFESPQQQLSCVVDKPVLCVAVAGGGILVSSSPAGGKTAWHKVSTALKVPEVTCLSASFCLGAGHGGFEFSTDPAGGAKAWHSTVIGKGTGSYQVSCPKPTFCAAVDGTSGDVLTSSHPTGGAKAWKVTDVNGLVKLAAISCPTASFCVATDDLGEILTTSHPAGGTSAWKRVTIGSTLESVTCLSTTACFGFVPTDEQNEVQMFSTTDPAGGASAWHTSTASWFVSNFKWFPPLTCPSAGLCVSGTLLGDIATSADPAGGLSTFGQPVSVDGSNGLAGVACLSLKLCLADDANGRLLTSTSPAAGKWAFTSVTASQLVCPSASLCLGTDGPDIVTSADPAGGPSTWHGGLADPNDPNKEILALRCTSASLCYAGNLLGQLLISTDPAGGASTWQQVNYGTTATGGLSDLYCPFATLCLSEGDGGLSASTTPTVSGSWHTYTLNSENKPVGPFTCPSPTLCVGIENLDQRSYLVTSTDPTGPASAWQVFEPAIHTSFGLPVCPSTFKCTTIGRLNGKSVIWTSTDPAGGAPTWRSKVAKGPLVEQSYCPTASFCIEPAGNGVLISTSRLAQKASWAHEVVAANDGITGISCVRTTLCIAVSGNGFIYVGTLKKS